MATASMVVVVFVKEFQWDQSPLPRFISTILQIKICIKAAGITEVRTQPFQSTLNVNNGFVFYYDKK